MSEKSVRRSTHRKPAAANILAQFLADPRRPSGTLRYHELQGFLFAVASAPDLVRPSEWMPEVFGGQEARFEDLEEAQAILPELMALYNAVNTSVASERAAIPSDCRFRRSVLANLEADAPEDSSHAALRPLHDRLDTSRGILPSSRANVPNRICNPGSSTDFACPSSCLDAGTALAL